ncbi:response regulator [Microvirga sp. 3-52]|nr:response regulator [Microvirga sp. 3-52]
MSIGTPQRILIADDNPDFRKKLAHCLRAQGHNVITAETGERAFMVLRDWGHPIDWLYTRASLPGLIDGWILADEYHEMHQNRAVIISTSEARVSSRGDIVLKQPILPTAFEAIIDAVSSTSQRQSVN